ncbi:unnamed protein product [Oikopleura dioica]|uniref:SAM-dependent methyltransferase RsmB-F/NOP2-type catalytic core domain-containing protein n=1 Tax=Oikopleura dioica TaxID=34765 RepID=E4XFF4_OIKDI|nr:unnamed protein product [Oikopleura dioica]
MFSPPIYTVIRCSKRDEFLSEMSKKLPDSYKTRYMKTPQIEKTGEELSLICIKTRIDNEVKPLRHPCDRQNYEEQNIIVDSSGGAALLRGADLFAPGIVTCTETFVGDIASLWCDSSNDPQSRSGKGKSKFILKGARFPIEECFRDQLVFLGLGKVLIPRSDIFCENPVKSGIAVQMYRPVFDCPPISNHFLESCSSEAMLQNYASIKICETFAKNLPKAYSSEYRELLDMCAAPGGKTAYLLNRLSNDKWYAADKPSRVEMLKKNTSKIETNVEIIAVDSTKMNFKNEKFDGILLDRVDKILKFY